MADTKEIAGYKLQQAILEDHLGILYAAEAQATENPAWIKVFPPTPYTIDPAIQQTFLEGARYLQSLRIPGLAQVFQAYSHRPSELHTAIERAQGEPLQSYLERGQGLSLASIAALIESLLHTLDHLHRSSVIHGDLRPASVSIGFPGLTQKPTVRLLHFGQGWWWSENLRQIGGFSKESIFFMPPEQAQGRPFDHRADLYAAGMILASLLFGSLPYGGDASAFQRDRQAFLTRLMPDLKRRQRHSVGLEDLLWRSLAPDPDERIASAHDFLRSFQQAFSSLDALHDQDERLHQPIDGSFSAALDIDTHLDPEDFEPSRDSTVVGPMPKRPSELAEEDDEFRPTQRFDLASSELMGFMETLDSRYDSTSVNSPNPIPPPPPLPPLPSQSGPVFGGAAAIPSRDDLPMFTVRHEPPHPLTPPPFLQTSSPSPTSSKSPSSPPRNPASVGVDLLGRDPLDVTLAGQRKRETPTNEASKTSNLKIWIVFAVILVILAGSGFAILQLLSSPTTPVDPEASNQVYITLSLNTEPPGAEIWLGAEKQVVATPADLKIRIGRSIPIQLRKDGFRPVIFSWNATGNDKRSFRLEPLPAPPSPPPSLAQTQPPTPTPQGSTPPPTPPPTVAPAPAERTSSSKLPPPPRKRIPPRNASRTPPSLPGGVTLSLQSHPPGASVFVNEQQWPTPTPARITLRPGAEVKIELKKYGHYDAFFVWKAEQTEQKTVRLSRLSWYNP